MLNSMMYKPNCKLEEFIKVYWILKGRGESKKFQKQFILPDGCATIVFVLQGELVVETYDNSLLTKGIYIVPPTLKSHYDLISEDIFLIDIQFNPGIFYALFNIPIEELSQRIYPFDEVLNNIPCDILDKLIEVKDNTKALIYQLDYFLTQLFYKEDFFSNDLLKNICYLYKSAKLDKFYERENLGIRQIQRKVKFMTGLSPKEISKMARFYKVLERFNNTNSSINFANIAFENKFADQSHFIKEFKTFTGVTPKSFMEIQEQYLQYKAFSKSEI